MFERKNRPCEDVDLNQRENTMLDADVLSPTVALPSKEEGETLIRRAISGEEGMRIGLYQYPLLDILAAWSAYCDSGQEEIPKPDGWGSINSFHGNVLKSLVVKDDIPGSPTYYGSMESQRMRWVEFFTDIGWVADAG